MSLAKKTEMCICVYVYMESLHTEWVSYTHTYMHVYISVFFPTDIWVLHKAPVEMGLCKALRSFMKTPHR